MCAIVIKIGYCLWFFYCSRLGVFGPFDAFKNGVCCYGDTRYPSDGPSWSVAHRISVSRVLCFPSQKASKPEEIRGTPSCYLETSHFLEPFLKCAVWQGRRGRGGGSFGAGTVAHFWHGPFRFLERRVHARLSQLGLGLWRNPFSPHTPNPNQTPGGKVLVRFEWRISRIGKESGGGSGAGTVALSINEFSSPPYNVLLDPGHGSGPSPAPLL